MKTSSVVHGRNARTGKTYCGRGNPGGEMEIVTCKNCIRVGAKRRVVVEDATHLRAGPVKEELEISEGEPEDDSELSEINSVLHSSFSDEQEDLRLANEALATPTPGKNGGDRSGLLSGGVSLFSSPRIHRERVELQIMKRLYGYVPLVEIEGRSVTLVDILYHLVSPFLRWRARRWMKKHGVGVSSRTVPGEMCFGKRGEVFQCVKKKVRGR